MSVFAPKAAGTVNLSATTSTGRVEFTSSTDNNGTVRVYNAGSATVFCEFGSSTVTAATTTGWPIPSGAVEVFSVGPGQTNVAGITSSGTATLYVTPGQGV